MDRRPINDIQEFPVTISLGGTSGTASDPCNPLISSVLKKVQAKVADDANVTGFKVEMQRYDWRAAAWVNVYLSDNQNIADNDTWNDADSDKDLDIGLNSARDRDRRSGNDYRWQVTVNAATAAEMTVYIRRTLIC